MLASFPTMDYPISPIVLASKRGFFVIHFGKNLTGSPYNEGRTTIEGL